MMIIRRSTLDGHRMHILQSTSSKVGFGLNLAQVRQLYVMNIDPLWAMANAAMLVFV